MATVKSKKGRIVPALLVSSSSTAKGSLGRHVNQRAGIGIFQQPQRAICGFRHIADTFSHAPTLGWLGAPFAVEDDAVERHSAHTADEAVSVPLGEGLGA